MVTKRRKAIARSGFAGIQRVVMRHSELPIELVKCKFSIVRWCIDNKVHLDDAPLEDSLGFWHWGIASDYQRTIELTFPGTLWVDWDVYIRDNAGFASLDFSVPFRAGEHIVWNAGETDIFEAALGDYLESLNSCESAFGERLLMLKYWRRHGFYGIRDVEKCGYHHHLRWSVTGGW